MGPSRGPDSERRERKPSDRKGQIKALPNQNSDRERFKGEGRGTGVTA